MMTESEFVSLKPGDFVHHPSQPDRVFTVIGRQVQYDSYLAVLGHQRIDSKNLWKELLSVSEEKCREIAKRFDLNVTRMINKGNWTKDLRTTYSCLLCDTITLYPHDCPVFKR